MIPAIKWPGGHQSVGEPTRFAWLDGHFLITAVRDGLCVSQRNAIHLSDCCLDAVMNALLCVSQRNAIHLRTFAPRLAKIPWLRRLSPREACVRKSPRRVKLWRCLKISPSTFIPLLCCPAKVRSAPTKKRRFLVSVVPCPDFVNYILNDPCCRNFGKSSRGLHTGSNAHPDGAASSVEDLAAGSALDA